MKITVKDAVLTAARLLGIDEGVERALDGEADEIGGKDLAILLNGFSSVENELALDYLPLLAEDEMVTATGRIAYAEFSRAVARILCVEDEEGQAVRYTLFPDYIQARAGKVKVTYAYAPQKKTIDGVSDYGAGVSLRLFAYGIAAEYSLAVGELTAASVWDLKYKDGIRAAERLRPGKRLRSRRWV